MLLSATTLSAQLFPERRHIRQGNKAYETLDYATAENDYRTAQIKSPSSVEATFNLADALYKQGRFEEAENTLAPLAEGISKNPTVSPEMAAKIYHNLGNAQFQQQKLSEAFESYKEAQRINPDDLETKYNLAYVKELLDENQDNNQNQQQENNQDQGGQNNDQNQNDNSDNQSKPDENQNNEGDNPGDQQNDNGEGDGDQRMEDTPPPPSRSYGDSRVNQAEAEQILGAVQQQEDRTREKVNAQQATAVAPSGKNW